MSCLSYLEDKLTFKNETEIPIREPILQQRQPLKIRGGFLFESFGTL